MNKNVRGGGATLDRKAFTLIELLAVIVILAIITLIATPIILNIISDTKDSANRRSVELYGKAVENAVADYMLLSNGVAPTWENISENDNIRKYYSGSEVICDNTIINEDGTVYLDGCKVGNKTVDYKYGERVTKKCSVVSGDGTQVGDEIACGTEHFYVISSDSENISMLAKYNLDIDGGYNSYNGTGIQDSNVIGNGYGAIAFTDTNSNEARYWHDTTTNNVKSEYGDSYPAYVYDSNSNLYPYVEGYKSYLESLGYLIKEARLIKKEELVTLGCSDTSLTCKDAPSWVYATSYWTGTAYDGGNISSGYYFVWNVLSDPTYDSYYPDDNWFGIRPVITVSKSDLS